MMNDENIRDAIQRLRDSQDSSAFIKALLKDPVAAQLFGLGQHVFDPGKDDAGRNRFVYTCKCGWVDVGHFFTSAGSANLISAGGQLRGKLNTADAEDLATSLTYIAGYVVELRQTYAKLRIGRFMAEKYGWAGSAFTQEDLASDYLGARFGAKFPLLAALKNSQAISKQIRSSFAKQMGECGIVDVNKPGVKDILNSDAQYFKQGSLTPRFLSWGGISPPAGTSKTSPYTFDSNPVKTPSHDKLCDCDGKPK